LGFGSLKLGAIAAFTHELQTSEGMNRTTPIAGAISDKRDVFGAIALINAW
jgi:hypothetical protein